MRLRLVGYAPDDRPKRQQGPPCAAAISAVRCGWAWRTPFAGNEVVHGIDELGFVSDDVMFSELTSWTAMVVPILHSTGVNTKLLPALQWGVPIVLTSVAASPLGIPGDESVALVADSAPAFVAQLKRLHADPDETARFASSSRRHWQRLLDDDATASDLLPLMALACDVTRRPPDERPMPMSLTAPAAVGFVAGLTAVQRQPAPSRCFPGELPPAIVVVMHSGGATDAAALLAHAGWAAVCRHCALACVASRFGAAAPHEDWDVLLVHEISISPEELASGLSSIQSAIQPRRLLLVHAPAAQLHAALAMYSLRGGVLASVAQGERARAQLPAALDAAGFPPSQLVHTLLEPVANGTRGAAVGVAWRTLLTSIGMRTTDVAPLVDVVEQLRMRLLAPLKWLGCYRDRAGDRDFRDGPRSRGHTTVACAGACADYPFFALQNGGQCFCAQRPGNASKRVAAVQCGRVCPAEEGKLPPRLCGGSWRNAVYANPLVLNPEERQAIATAQGVAHSAASQSAEPSKSRAKAYPPRAHASNAPPPAMHRAPTKVRSSTAASSHAGRSAKEKRASRKGGSRSTAVGSSSSGTRKKRKG